MERWRLSGRTCVFHTPVHLWNLSMDIAPLILKQSIWAAQIIDSRIIYVRTEQSGFSVPYNMLYTDTEGSCVAVTLLVYATERFWTGGTTPLGGTRSLVNEYTKYTATWTSDCRRGLDWKSDLSEIYSSHLQVTITVHISKQSIIHDGMH
jgi:hypothetical protein